MIYSFAGDDLIILDDKMMDEKQAFEIIKKDLIEIGIKDNEIKENEKLGIWVPDILVRQHGKIVTIIEHKSRAPSRQLILNIINRARGIVDSYSVGSVILAYGENDKIKYIDLTDMVLSYEVDITYRLNALKDSSLYDILSLYCNLKQSKSMINDQRMVRQRGKNTLQISLWIASLLMAATVLVFDIVGIYKITWERIVYVLIILVFASLPSFETIVIGREGVVLRKPAIDRGVNDKGKRTDTKK